MDFGALLRKLGGDQSADVLPNYDNVKIDFSKNTGRWSLPISATNAHAKGGSKYKAPRQQNSSKNTTSANNVAGINTAGQAVANAMGGFVGGGYDPQAAAIAAQEAEDAAERGRLRDAISGYRGRSNTLFEDIFDRIKAVAKDRRRKIDDTYNDQDAQYVAQYGEAVPQIDNSFAALGIGNSTYAGDRIDDAKEAMDSSLAKSKTNRQADLGEVGNWQESQLGAFQSDQQNIEDAIKRSGSVEDLGELRDARNNVSSTLNTVSGKRRAFNADGTAINKLEAATGRSKNFDDAMKALQGVLSSSMDVGTKRAAKDALVENANLSDDEKKKLSEVQINNPYTAPAA